MRSFASLRMTESFVLLFVRYNAVIESPSFDPPGRRTAAGTPLYRKGGGASPGGGKNITITGQKRAMRSKPARPSARQRGAT